MELDKNELYEEIPWKKKSRVQWLKEGDWNTKFFHNSLLQIRNQNMITSIIQSSGEIIDSTEDIEKELVNHFKQIILELEKDRKYTIQEITNHIPKIVTPDQTKILMGPTSLKEVERIVMEMKTRKSLGPNKAV